MLHLLAAASRVDWRTVFLLIAAAFAIGGIYLLIARNNVWGAVCAVLLAIVIVVFLT